VLGWWVCLPFKNMQKAAISEGLHFMGMRIGMGIGMGDQGVREDLTTIRRALACTYEAFALFNVNE